MSYFEAWLSVEKIKLRPKALWRLNRDLRYYSERLGDWIIVPKDFVTDFASVPRLPVAFLLTGGKGDEAAVIHDWLYSLQHLPRELCDEIFKEALVIMGYSAATVSFMYAGVRIGGGWTWNLPNAPQTSKVIEEMLPAA